MTIESVQEYYGRILKSAKDLKTSACCSAEVVPSHVREIAALIHPEVAEKFYGCGVVIPQILDGLTVLDLGCGSGRDCFLLSKLVGESGRVIGVDMTEEQLAVARRHVDYHAEMFGFKRSNVTFVKGFIEDLESAGIENASVDLIVSNCVVNLSPDKMSVMREALRVLRPGGEIYFSDVFSDRRLPKSARQDPVLLGECLGGAFYVEDFRRMMAGLGVADYRVISRSPIGINDAAMRVKLGGAEFTSFTLRVFKLNLEDRCEDYGQVAYYLGTIPESPNFFDLDDHHHFEAHKPMTVCSNTAAMLTDTRYRPHFRVVGDLSRHFGLFDCGPDVGAVRKNETSSGACC